MGSVMKSVVAAMALMLAVVFVPLAAQAQVNPTASAVSEQQLLQSLQGGSIAGRVSIPDARAAELIKPGNPEWRERHQGLMFWVSVGSILAMLVVLVLFYALRGPIRVESGLTGVKLLRFNALDRFGHWLSAGCFVVLGLTGLNLVVGRYVLLPLIGPEAFGTVTAYGKLAHNYLAWPFMLGLILMFVVWVKDNLPRSVDATWLAAGGGMFGGAHPPAGKFNAGQKIVFWIVIIGGAALSVTGVLLMFPFLLGGASDWQLMQFLHGVIGGLMVALMLGHIYLGSVGMEGAFGAMSSGEVDLSWAREHHALWAEEMKVAGRTPPRGAVATPAE